MRNVEKDKILIFFLDDNPHRCNIYKTNSTHHFETSFSSQRLTVPLEKMCFVNLDNTGKTDKT